MERYIGIDVHSASCTVAVLSAKGKRISCTVLETNGKVLVDFLKTIPSNRHLIIEEGNHSSWLHEILSPHVFKMVVVGVQKKNKGPKNDEIDAFALAEKLRIGSIETKVFKGTGEYSLLDSCSRAYRNVMYDTVRVKNRLKSVFRSRGISTDGKEIYLESCKEKWLKKLPDKTRPLAETYYLELKVLMEVRVQAEKDMLKELKKHFFYRTLKTIPGLGANRIAEMLPIIITPYRFQNKRDFWGYCGFGVLTHNSSDWVHEADGSWVRAQTKKTRGLNFNHNHYLKSIFKGAATTVIGQKQEKDPIFQHYLSLLKNGTKPDLAKLTIARQIASITLSLMRSKEEYDPKKMKNK